MDYRPEVVKRYYKACGDFVGEILCWPDLQLFGWRIRTTTGAVLRAETHEGWTLTQARDNLLLSA